MNLYKRIFKNVEGFRDLTEENKERAIYLYKHKYVGLILFLKEATLVQLCICLLGLAFSILGNSLDNNLFSNIAFVLIMILLPRFIVDVYMFIRLMIIKINRYNRNISDVMLEITDKIANIGLLNHKVITRKNWRKIKRYNKYQYRYLRSEECNHECYDITEWLANFIKDPEIKILWISAEDVFDNHRYGHAILKKGEWVYDSNSRRTYKFENYMKAYKAEIFREFSLSGDEYFKGDSYKIAYKEFGIWCKEHGVKRCSED